MSHESFKMPSLGESKTTSINQAHLEFINIAADLPIYLAGGYAEDALLGGEVASPHKDIDFMCSRQDVPTLLEALKQRGYSTHFTGRNSGDLSDAFMVFATNGDVDIDIILVDDNHGIHADLANAEGAKFRVFLDDQAFSYPSTELNRIKAKTVSPQSLIQARYIVRSIQGRPERQGYDEIRQQALIDKYFPGMTEEELKPEIIKLD